MKKALVIANMLFASATVFGMNNFQTERSYNSEQTQRFVEALQQGNIEQIGQEIQNGADVNNIIVNKMTPLIFAIKSSNYDMVKTLVNKGRANIYQNGAFDIAMQGSEKIKDFIEYSNYCNLVKAVRNNDVDGVRSALNYGTTRVNEKFYEADGAKGYTPLMYAASRGNLDIVDLLLYNGARVNVVSDSGDNALFFAARNGKTEVLDRLINVSIGDVKAAVVRSNKKENLKRNINRAAIVASYRAESALTQRNDLDHTLLISALKNGREDTAIWLINHGANVNEECDGESPLMIASKYGQATAIAKLLDKGADINFSNENGTVLDYILQSNEGTLSTELKEQFAKILIDQGIQIDRPKNLLFWSARNDYLEMTKSLLNRVDDVNFKNQNNETPFMVALKEKHLDVSEVLFSDKVNLDEAYVYTKEERDNWDNIIQITYKGTILTWAARNSDSDVMEWLIRHGANLDVMETIRKHYKSKRSSTTTSYCESLLSIAQKRGGRVFDTVIYYDSLESIVDMFQKAEAVAR